jgi:hypothetical protein
MVNLIGARFCSASSICNKARESFPPDKPNDDDDDVYLNKLQTKGVKKSILYMKNVDQPIRHK